jgi:hypothetical protein
MTTNIGTFCELQLLISKFTFFYEEYFWWTAEDCMKILAYHLLIIEFIEILVKLKNIAHEISVE